MVRCRTHATLGYHMCMFPLIVLCRDLSWREGGRREQGGAGRGGGNSVVSWSQRSVSVVTTEVLLTGRLWVARTR